MDSVTPPGGLREEIESALKNDDIESIYFNGFVNALGTGDVVIVLQRNDKKVAVLNTSYTVAKSLAQKLTSMIEFLERESGNTIMTTEDVHSRLHKD